MKEDNGILIVTVWETRPDDDDMVTDALTYPSMIVSISPRPEYVVFQDQDGTVFELLRPEEK